jgi:hypothetical protein
MDAGKAHVGDIPRQLIARESVPQPQRRQCNRLRAVRIQAKKPGPNQAI